MLFPSFRALHQLRAVRAKGVLCATRRSNSDNNAFAPVERVQAIDNLSPYKCGRCVRSARIAEYFGASLRYADRGGSTKRVPNTSRDWQGSSRPTLSHEGVSYKRLG
jgi:hypothetical protein